MISLVPPLALMGVGAVLWQQTAPSGGPDPWSKLAVYGPLGIFAGALLWFAWQAYNKAIKDRDEERAYSKELEQKLRDDIMPLLAKISDTLGDVIKIITEARAEMSVRREQRRRTGG